MELKDFERVYESFDFLDRAKIENLEKQFVTEDDFTWNLGFKDRGVVNETIEDLVSFDLGLEEGEVKNLYSSLGCRMIFIGTCVGNVVIHQRKDFKRYESADGEERYTVNVVSYVPEALRSIVSNKTLNVNELYRYTGFLNSRSNIGNSLATLRDVIVND